MWMEYLKQQWDTPSRTDYYLMSLVRELRLLRRIPAAQLSWDSLKVWFTKSRPKVKAKQLTAAEVAARDKAILFPLMGLKVPSK